MYRKFQKGLHLYFDVGINNKKIAEYINQPSQENSNNNSNPTNNNIKNKKFLTHPEVNSNHVRYVKSAYLKSLKLRGIKNKINRKDQLLEDIENEFDINVF